MENSYALLDAFISDLQKSTVGCNGTEICALDKYQIVINIIKGDNNVICKNSNVFSKNSNVSISEATPCASDEWQCILLDKYNHLDVFCQAKLITYADELIAKSGVSV